MGSGYIHPERRGCRARDDGRGQERKREFSDLSSSACPERIDFPSLRDLSRPHDPAQLLESLIGPRRQRLNLTLNPSRSPPPFPSAPPSLPSERRVPILPTRVIHTKKTRRDLTPSMLPSPTKKYYVPFVPPLRDPTDTRGSWAAAAITGQESSIQSAAMRTRHGSSPPSLPTSFAAGRELMVLKRLDGDINCLEERGG